MICNSKDRPHISKSLEDIWRLSPYLNIYNCCHFYKEANRTTNCLVKKGNYNTNPNIWCSDFPRDVINSVLKIIVVYFC